MMAVKSDEAVVNVGKRFVLEQVETQAVLKKEWWPLLKEIFPDKDDQEPLKQLGERFKDKQRNAFYILRDTENNNKAVGIELRQTDPAIPGAMYVPWAGVTEPYRNRGIYPLMADICDRQMKEVGAKYVLFEVEDPKRIHVAYPDEKPADISKMAEGRINFWRRATGSVVVRDPAIDYVRPASSDDRKIQGYDLLSLRVLDEKDPQWKGVFNADKTAIHKNSYRKFYMEMTKLQYGNKPEADLRRELPAVEQMLTVLDSHPKQWLSLEVSAVRPDQHVKPPVQVDLATAAVGRKPRKDYSALPAAPDSANGAVAVTYAAQLKGIEAHGGEGGRARADSSQKARKKVTPTPNIY